MKRALLFLLIMVLTVSVCGCKKSEGLIAAEEAVKAIGTVSLDSSDAIKNAEAAVAKLNDEEKQKFKMGEALDAAKNEYEKIVIEEAVSEVEDAISQMGEISIDNLEGVNSAQAKYDKLSSEAKAMVKNYDVLSAAQEKLSADKKARADELLSTMKVEEDRVRNYKFYYPAGWKHYSDGWAADIKSFVLPYLFPCLAYRVVIAIFLNSIYMC